MFWALIACILPLVLYYYFIRPLRYWKDRGVPYLAPCPLFGNMLPLTLGKISFHEHIQILYGTFPNERYMGVFLFQQPRLMIKDVNLIKLIGIKDFDIFVNRSIPINENVEPLFAKDLATLQDQMWRDLRATLTPTFTSAKMKLMFDLIVESALQCTRHFEYQNCNEIEINVRDTCSRFTNDVIVSTTFGIPLNSFKDVENEFLSFGQVLTNFDRWSSFKLFILKPFPVLMRLLKFSIFPVESLNFFREVIRGNIREREETGIVRPDMIQSFLEEGKKREGKRGISIEIIVAQAVLFYRAGFGTTSTLLSFMCYELAVNPEIQRRLQSEIDGTLHKCNVKIGYEDILGMKYLDMVVSETLRLWPPIAAVDRVCSKDYVIPSECDNRSLPLEKGSCVVVPIFGIHRDPNYFPHPNVFNPDRFSDDNKRNIIPNSYIPFGFGPRNCIASRLALLETKVLFCYLLSRFDLVPTKKTIIPVQMQRKGFVLVPDDLYIGLRRRTLS